MLLRSTTQHVGHLEIGFRPLAWNFAPPENRRKDPKNWKMPPKWYFWIAFPIFCYCLLVSGGDWSLYFSSCIFLISGRGPEAYSLAGWLGCLRHSHASGSISVCWFWVDHKVPIQVQIGFERLSKVPLWIAMRPSVPRASATKRPSGRTRAALRNSPCLRAIFYILIGHVLARCVL